MGYLLLQGRIGCLLCLLNTCGSCLDQERGPRYVNNVAVFVKKGQKDIDANERPCHAEMSSMDCLKTVANRTA